MSGVNRILVDADACPVKQIIVREAKWRQIPVVMVCDTSHELNDGYSTVIVVDKARDSADLRLANLMRPGDRDTGLWGCGNGVGQRLPRAAPERTGIYGGKH